MVALLYPETPPLWLRQDTSVSLHRAGWSLTFLSSQGGEGFRWRIDWERLGYDTFNNSEFDWDMYHIVWL